MWHLVDHWILLSLGTFRWFPAGTLKLAEYWPVVYSISTVLQAPRARQLLERVSLRGVSQVEPHLVRFVVYSIIPFKLAHWANYNSVLFYSTKLRVSFILSTIDTRNANYSPPIVSNPRDYNILGHFWAQLTFFCFVVEHLPSRSAIYDIIDQIPLKLLLLVMI